MRIVFAASEAAPFIKTGGLGDVAQALPAALSEYKGNEVLLFLPYYASIKNDASLTVERVAEFETELSWRNAYVGLMKLKGRRRKLQVYFIDNEYYFNRERIYGEYDDGERYAFFCKAILESLVYLSQKVDIIHCNDWQTALIPALLHSFYSEQLGGVKTVFTIHNIEYQGWASPHFLSDVLGLSYEHENTFEYNGAVNFLKGAILSSDALTTVSETYAEEITRPEFAHGLSGIISEHSFKLCGIVNGIDVNANDPQKDTAIAKNYGAEDFSVGKTECKRALQKKLGLAEDEDIPLIGMVSRIVGHKGFDVICDSIDSVMAQNVQLVVLGTGESELEKRLGYASERYPEKLSVNLRFDKKLASEIYAASDIYLMPSRSEPCGLSQMIAMRYGSVPVVHETGGLKDTVEPFDKATGLGVGFTFSGLSAENLTDALRRALGLYENDRGAWNMAVRNGMSAELSWKRSAIRYMELYKSLIERE